MGREALADPGPGNGRDNDQTVTRPSAGNATTRVSGRSAHCRVSRQDARSEERYWAAMKTYINNLTPNGGTNQNIGLAWAWMTLKGGGPPSGHDQ